MLHADARSSLRVSATTPPAPDVVQPTVTKLVDTSTCIGCKACEVACQEWNDLPPETTARDGHVSDAAGHDGELLEPDQVQRARDATDALHWLMRKDQCMHCAEPGCLIACPAPGAIVQYANGIVDFNQDQCIGCGYCMTGCPFNVPKFADEDATRLQVHDVRRSRVGRTAAGVRQGVPDQLPAVRHEGRRCWAWPTRRVEQLKANGFPQAAVYDPPGVGGTGVVTVLAFGDRPELYGLPAQSRGAAAVRVWKGRSSGSATWRSSAASARRRCTTCGSAARQDDEA